ncbi:MAG TPA: RluA family pseudouridine synthase [Thermoanaerobaculia bacterium]|nr:RluA family pseudouridine synthase [Thermoanaerobaculia bacterium]
MTPPERLSFRHRVVAGDPPGAADVLARVSGLSKGVVKDAMRKGAVHVGRAGRTPNRLRRETATVRPGDVLEIHYDAALLALVPPEARLVRDAVRWSAWDKPAGLLTQGTPFGDHATLLRQAEKALGRPALPVHRLDREVSGLVLVAHDEQAAAALSALLREGRVVKRYRAEVLGDVASALGREGVVDTPLDGKNARTLWRVVSHDAERGATTLDVTIETGRQHQIRRHLESIGHPVLGDPRYGAGNKNRDGMRLAAVFLAFRDPYTGEEVALSTHGK